MAVYAAHLTRTLQGTPSVFQVTAQDALGATVKPALRKLVEYLAAVHPNKCGWCVRWFDELYLVFDCCLQYHYLKHYAASFAESFYGLLRVPTTVSNTFSSGQRLPELLERGSLLLLVLDPYLRAASFSESFYGLLRVPTTVSNEFSSGQRLPELLERGSLLLLVLAPYLRDRAESLVATWREDDEDGRLRKSIPDRLRRAAVRVYSILHLVTSAARVIQLARYMTGGARSHAPELALLGVTLKDAPPREEDDHSWTDLGRNLRMGQLGSAIITFPMIGRLLLRGVEYGAFGVQFLRWWEARSAAPSAALPPPPPPVRDEKAVRCKNRCPLCLQVWKIPTVLPVSGYIFCYVCISRHVRRHAACPVSRCPAAEASLVRLYID